jgi:hypothetical protein
MNQELSDLIGLRVKGGGRGGRRGLTQLKMVGASGPISRSCHGCAATERREMEERIRSLSAGVFLVAAASLVLAAASAAGGAIFRQGKLVGGRIDLSIKEHSKEN